MNPFCAKRVLSQNGLLVARIEAEIARHSGNIDFSGFRVDDAVFPVRALHAASKKVLAEMGAEALQYSSSHDYMPLKAKLRERYGAFGLALEDGDFTITNGATQGIDMVCKALVDEGDCILVESPVSWSVLQTMTMYRPGIIEVPAGDIAALEMRLKEKKPKFFYCAPTFQDPTGGTLPHEKRAAVADLMKAYDCIVVESDLYGELGAGDERPGYIKALAGDSGILVGSFSQILGPGLRVGWVCCTSPELRPYFTSAKQKTDSHTNGYIQRVLWRYLADNDLAAHAKAVRGVYAEKRAVTLAAMAAHFPKTVSFTMPEGGNFVWVTLPEGKSPLEFYEDAMAAGVSILPGDIFSLNPARGFRLSYAGAGADEIAGGIKILAGLLA